MMVFFEKAWGKFFWQKFSQTWDFKVEHWKIIKLSTQLFDFKGPTKLYFMHYRPVVITLFKRVYANLRFIPNVVEKQCLVILCFLCFFVCFMFWIWCHLFRHNNICIIIVYINAIRALWYRSHINIWKLWFVKSC